MTGRSRRMAACPERDRNALESAVQRPRDAAYYRPDASTAELAASLAYGLAKNHAFNDANKRTSLACTGIFLRLNDCRVVASNQDLYDSWVLLAEGGLAEGDLATWLALRLVTIDNPHPPLR